MDESAILTTAIGSKSVETVATSMEGGEMTQMKGGGRSGGGGGGGGKASSGNSSKDSVYGDSASLLALAAIMVWNVWVL